MLGAVGAHCAAGVNVEHGLPTAKHVPPEYVNVQTHICKQATFASLPISSHVFDSKLCKNKKCTRYLDQLLLLLNLVHSRRWLGLHTVFPSSELKTLELQPDFLQHR